MTDDDQTQAAAVTQDTASIAPRVYVRYQWSVQDFPAHLEPGTEVEIKTTRRDGRIVLTRWSAANPAEGNLRVEGICTAYLSRRLSPVVRDVLEVLWAAPPVASSGMGTDVSQHSPAFRDWVAGNDRDLHEDATAILRLVRWHSRKLSPAQPLLGALGSQFSMDGDSWVPLPVQLSGSASSHGFRPLSMQLVASIEESFAHGEREPLCQELLREAWSLHYTNIITAVVVIVMALELAAKEFISLVVPNADWLAFNAPSPPVRDILTQYVPDLIASTSSERVALPSEWADVVRDAVQLRNVIVHTKSRPTVSLDRFTEIFDVIRAIVDGLEHYRGVPWAPAWPPGSSIRPQ